MQFIILATHRTGSTLLVSYLNCHEKTPCQSELFQAKATTALTVPRYTEWRRFYRRSIVRYLKQYLPENGGFKLMYGQLSSYQGLRKYLLKSKPLIIHLQRKNLLRRYVSLQLARETDKWSSSGDPSSPHSIELNPQATLQSLRRTEQQVHNHRVFQKTNPYIDIYYEDLSRKPENVLARIWEKLGEEPVELSTHLTKQNPYSLKSLITNFRDVQQALDGTGYEWMLYDP